MAKFRSGLPGPVLSHWVERLPNLCRSRYFALPAAAWIAACSTAPYAPAGLETPGELHGVQAQTIGDVSVTVAMLSDEQAKSHFGADLSDNDLQTLWLSVENSGCDTLWFIRNVVDPDYYSADEAAYTLRGEVRDEEFDRLRQRLRDEEIRAMILPGAVTDGFVYLPRKEGGRYVDVRLLEDAWEDTEEHEAMRAGGQQPCVSSLREMRFGFALTLPDGDFDYERLDTENTYAGTTLPDLGDAGLRGRLEQLPCCVTNSGGDRNGDPLNVVLVGDATELMTALSRSGWSFTHRIDFNSIRRELGAAIAGSVYPVAPVSSLYVFGRKQDIALQRARDTLSQRNHMRLWLAPYTHGGRQVWVGQISRDIGIKLTARSATLTTHVIDPQVDETREYLLHSLLAEGLVARFGFVGGVTAATPDTPASNLTGDPWFSDGLRLVMVLSPDPIPYQEVRSLQWERSAAPVAEGQSEAAAGHVRPIEPEPR